MGQEWYYQQNGQKHGPISGASLKQLAAAGKLQPTDLIWKEGMAKWVSARSVKGLFPAAPAPVATVAPPPPPVKAASLVADGTSDVVEVVPAATSSPAGLKGIWRRLSTPVKFGVLGGTGCVLLLLIFLLLLLGRGKHSDAVSPRDRLLGDWEVTEGPSKGAKISFRNDDKAILTRLGKGSPSTSLARFRITNLTKDVNLSFSPSDAQVVGDDSWYVMEFIAHNEVLLSETSSKGKGPFGRLAGRLKKLESGAATSGSLAAAQEPPEQAIPATPAAEIIADYDKDQAAADAKYRGKQMTFRGVVWIKSPNSLHLKGGTNLKHTLVCKFLNERTIASVRKGDTVTVKGVCSGQDKNSAAFRMVFFEDCELVGGSKGRVGMAPRKAGNRPAPNPATEVTHALVASRIRPGMTPPEVEGILGPPDDEKSMEIDAVTDGDGRVLTPAIELLTCIYQTEHDGEIVLVFRNGRLSGAESQGKGRIFPRD
jgi:hypothetical protein